MNDKDLNINIAEAVSNLSLDEYLRIRLEGIEKQKAKLALEEEKLLSMTSTPKIAVKPSAVITGVVKESKDSEDGSGVTKAVYSAIESAGDIGLTNSAISELTGYTVKQVRDAVTKLGRQKKISGIKTTGLVKTYYIDKKIKPPIRGF